MSKNVARTAGLLYLVVIVTGIFSLAYVPSQIHTAGSASAAMNNIAASMPLFRLGALSELTQYVFMLFLMVPLYKLFRPVNKNVAWLMIMLVVVGMSIDFVAVGNKLDVLSLLSNNSLRHALTTKQVGAQVMLSLTRYNNGILISEIFWGLWLFPFGYLVFKSGFLPKILGVFLVLGGIYYVVLFLGGLFHFSVPFYAVVPDAIGEIGIGLWLLIIGARRTVRSKPDVSLSSA